MIAGIIADTLFIVGLFINVTVSVLALWGLIGFYPRKSTRGYSAASILILAIWLGFLGVFVHSLSSGVVGQLTVQLGLIDLDTWHHYIRPLANIIWNLAVGLSIYLHFFARFRSISTDEQSYWHPLLMGFYPDLTHWAVKTGKKMTALYKRNGEG